MLLHLDLYVEGSKAYPLIAEAEFDLRNWSNNSPLVCSNHSVIWAEERKEPIGCLVFSIRDGQCWIPLAYVTEAHRRRGVFTAMLGKLLERCRTLSASMIGLGAHVENARACKVYKNLGFREVFRCFYLEVGRSQD